MRKITRRTDVVLRNSEEGNITAAVLFENAFEKRECEFGTSLGTAVTGLWMAFVIRSGPNDGVGEGSRWAGIVRRNDAAVGRSAAKAVKHAVCCGGNADDGVATVALVPQECGHHADDVRPVACENDA